MASKKQQASSTARSGASEPPQQAQSQGERLGVNVMLNTLRLVALMSATIVALLVYELLQNTIGFWPALGVGFVAGIIARAAFVWLERVWLRAAARRAHAQAREPQARVREPGGSPRATNGSESAGTQFPQGLPRAAARKRPPPEAQEDRRAGQDPIGD